MIYYDYYADFPLDTLRAFVQQREMGRLVTVTGEGLPHIGLYPFAYEERTIELHLNKAREAPTWPGPAKRRMRGGCTSVGDRP